MRLLKKIGSIAILPLSEMYECGTKNRKFMKCERDVRNVRNVRVIQNNSIEPKRNRDSV